MCAGHRGPPFRSVLICILELTGSIRSWAVFPLGSSMQVIQGPTLLEMYDILTLPVTLDRD